MQLDRKREPEIVPSYSLTGDLISFLRCGLQYRYHSGSALPPSRPVQLWFGEFIHGVMESAYRLWSSTSAPPPFPWPCNPTDFLSTPPQRAAHDIGTLGDVVEATLRSQGKLSRSRAARASAYVRADSAVNEIAPHLFPLVAAAEQRVIGTRTVPHAVSGTPANLRADRYELHGIIDVLTDLQLQHVPPGNIIRRAIERICPNPPAHFEVIVDYKGSRRPATNHPFWAQGEWQLQTYAWLRTRQPNSLPVAAGVLIYVNELAPGNDDLVELKREMRQSTADEIPVSGTQDAYELSLWREGAAIPSFSQAFRMRRAIRVVPVTAHSQASATSHFDQVVLQIEQCVSNEASVGTISGYWTPCGDAETCVACDFRHFCPNPYPQSTTPRSITAPFAP